MTLEFWITTAAIVLGPLAAVLISQHLQKGSEKHQRKMWVFRALMITRRTPLSPDRVHALNLVEVEFYQKRLVMDAFGDLLKVYNDLQRWKSEDETVRRAVIQDVDDKTVVLLKEIGSLLGYQLDNLGLLRSGYYPEAFTMMENQQAEIRDFLVGLNRGSKMIPTAVVDVRHPEAMLKQAREAHLLVEAAKVAEGDER